MRNTRWSSRRSGCSEGKVTAGRYSRGEAVYGHTRGGGATCTREDVDDAVTRKRVICSPMNLVNVLFARSWPGTSFQEVGCFFGLSLHTNRHAAKTTKLILKRVEIQ